MATTTATSVTAIREKVLPAGSKRIMVFAHDAGSAIGMNPYKDPGLVRDGILKKLFPAFDPGMATESVERRKEIATEAAVADPVVMARAAEATGAVVESAALHEAAAVLEDAVASRAPESVQAAARVEVETKAAAAVEAVIQSTAAVIEAAPGDKGGAVAEAVLTSPALEAVPEVGAAAKAVGFTRRGNRGEAAALAKYAEESGEACNKPTRFYCKTLKAGRWPLQVGGYVDGLQGADTVVEVKCRQSRFFDMIPMRELAQMYVYMFITGRRRAVWLQALGDEIRATDLDWDSETWEKMVRALLGFREGVLDRVRVLDLAAASV